MALTFEWDVRKALVNKVKHGVDFTEALTIFDDPFGRISLDPRHSIAEERLVLLGVSRQGRLLAVMFTERGSNTIHLISAREATRREREDYEKVAQ
jgi:uncharacterized protein